MNKILSLPESFLSLSGKMRGVFTEQAFSNFTEFIKGILVGSRCNISGVTAHPA